MNTTKALFGNIGLAGLIVFLTSTLFYHEDSIPVFLIHYVLYLISLLYLILIFWTERLKGKEKNWLNWTIASVAFTWLICLDFALPTTKSATLSLLKLLFYLVVLIGYTDLIFDFAISSLNKYLLTITMVLISLNFSVRDIDWGIYERLLLDQSTLISLLLNRSTILLFAIVFFMGIFRELYWNDQKGKTALGQNYYSLISSIILFIISAAAIINNPSIASQIGLQTRVYLPFSSYRFLPLLLYVPSLGFLANIKNKKRVETLYIISFFFLYLAAQENGIQEAIQQVIRFQEGTIGKYITYGVGIMSIIATIIAILEIARVKEEKTQIGDSNTKP